MKKTKSIHVKTSTSLCVKSAPFTSKSENKQWPIFKIFSSYGTLESYFAQPSPPPKKPHKIYLFKLSNQKGDSSGLPTNKISSSILNQFVMEGERF